MVPQVQPRFSVYLGLTSMSSNSNRRLVVITALLMAPAVLLLLVGVPQMIAAFVGLASDGELTPSSISRDAMIGCLKIIGGVLALLELLRLAVRTIRGKKYVFGIRFFIALMLGLVATLYSYALFGLEAALFFSLPLLLLAYRMWRLQSQIANSDAPGGA